MPRWFNIAGPCDSNKHYMLPPERRLPGLMPLIAQELYFVVHAARQTGKTTAMRAFAARLREQGYVAVHATLEESQGVEEVEEAEPIWMTSIERAASACLSPPERPSDRQSFNQQEPGTRLRLWLEA